MFLLGLFFTMAIPPALKAQERAIDYDTFRKELELVNAKLTQLRANDGKMDATIRMSSESRQELVEEIRKLYAEAKSVKITKITKDQTRARNITLGRMDDELANIPADPSWSARKQADDLLLRKRYPECVQMYYKAETEAGSNMEEAAYALYQVGLAWHESNSNGACVAAWARLRRKYPTSSYAPKSLLLMSQYHLKLGTTRAVGELEEAELLKYYPKSSEAEVVRERQAKEKADKIKAQAAAEGKKPKS